MSNTTRRKSIFLIEIICAGVLLVATLIGILMHTVLNSFNSSNKLDNSIMLSGTDMWNSSTQKLNTDIAKNLINLLSAEQGYDALVGATMTANDIRTLNSDKSLVIKLGNYDWIATYLSQSSNTDSDVILTLYMADAQGNSTFGNSTTNVGKNDANGLPTSMYGTSYIRTNGLNNTGSYINITGRTNPTTANQQYTASATHNFALFTYSDSAFLDYILPPKYVSWQQTGQNNTLSGAPYTLSNDNLSTSTPNSEFWNGKAQYNFSSKQGYDAWGEDYLWLPSLCETGQDDSYSGLWQLTVAERSNSVGDAWVRSSYHRDNTNAYLVSQSGDTAVGYAVNNSSYASVSASHAVRPAMHLNLTAVYKSIPIEVTLLDAVNSDSLDTLLCYIGKPMPILTSTYLRTGYTFEGIYSSAIGGIQYYNASYSGTRNYDTSNFTIILYAQYVPITYRISYNNNGGSGSIADSVHTYDVFSNLSTNTFTRRGYTYTGWNTKSNGSGTSYQDEQSVMNLADTDTTVILYAQWSINTYVLTADAQGGTITPTQEWAINGSIATKSLQYGMVYGTLPTVSKAGYIFEGWHTLQEGGDTVTATISIADADVTIFAQWSPIPSYITASSADTTMGTVYLTSGEVLSGESWLNYAIAQSGYSFLYWQKTDAYGTTRIYENPLNDMVESDTTYVAYFGYALLSEYSATVAQVVAQDGKWVNATTDTDKTVGRVNMIGYTQSDVDYIHLSATAHSGYKFVGFATYDITTDSYALVTTLQDDFDDTADVLASDIIHKVVYACFVKNS